MEIRSFLAFELPKDIKTVVADTSRDMKKFSLNVRWVKPENIHLTVIFIGNIRLDYLAPLGEKTGQVCNRFGPFQVSLKGVGIFGSKNYPRVIWTRLEGDLKPMTIFRDKLRKNLEPFGIKVEKRSFKPHLTLGRFRKGTSAHLDEFLTKFEDLSSPICTLDELVLFKSELKPTGAFYTKLDSWALTGRD